MNEEEIRSRILICEIRERDYREVGNAKTAERYRNEIYKWEELLDKINPKNYEDLQKYKYGYIRLEKENQQLKNELEQSNAVADTNKELAENFRKEIERLKGLLKCDYEDGQSIMAELTTENKQLKENNLAMQEEMAKTWVKLEQKENIINKTKDIIEQMLTTGYSKGLTYYYPAKNGEFGIRAKVLLEILDNKGDEK